ncbi:MAG: hypothetical protein R2867_41440 [Caldilineaceae bacterium]
MSISCAHGRRRSDRGDRHRDSFGSPHRNCTALIRFRTTASPARDLRQPRRRPGAAL